MVLVIVMAFYSTADLAVCLSLRSGFGHKAEIQFRCCDVPKLEALQPFFHSQSFRVLYRAHQKLLVSGLM